MTHYTSIFKGSKVLSTSRYGDGGPMPKGTVMTIAFELEGQEFIALNGGPAFKFNEAISLLVDCDSQKEVDELWSRLSAGGEEGPCGWVKDKFGLSWQIIPSVLVKLIQDPDPAKAQMGQTGVAKVPDPRLDWLSAKFNPKKTTPTALEFLDTPGLLPTERRDNPRRLGILRDQALRRSDPRQLIVQPR